MKKLLVTIAALTLIVTGCGNSNVSSDSTPAQGSSENAPAAATPADPAAGDLSGSEIHIMARAGQYYNILSEISSQFTEQTGIRVNVQEVGRDGFLQKVSTQLLGGSNSVDAVVTINNYVGQFAAGGQFENLDPFIEKYGDNMDRFLPIAQEAVTYNGSVYAMPVNVGTMFLIYRSDLIQTPPATWDEYLQVAKQFTKSATPDSVTEFGATFQGKRGETLPKEWYQLLWSMGGEIFDEDMKPLLDSEASIKAVNYVYDLYKTDKVLAPDTTTYDFPECLSAFQNEKVAMSILWNSGIPQLKNEETSPLVYDKYAIAPVPGVSFNHSWTIAMNSASKSKDAAYQYMAWLTGEEGAKQYALAGDIPPVKAVLEDAEVLAKYPEYEMIIDTLGKAKGEPNIPEWPVIHEMIAESLSKVLADEKKADEAMTELNQRIEDTMQKAGYYK